MKKVLKLKYVLVLSGLLALSSCTDLDQEYPAAQKPVATMDITSATIAEGESVTFTVMIDQAQSLASDFKIDLLTSSDGDWDDFTTDAPHLDEYEVGPEGWQTTVNALENSVSFTITSLRDLDPNEGDEMLRFRLTKGQQGNSVVSGGAIDFNVRVTDFDFCLWTFEMTDLYGDGWNGGYLEVVSDFWTREFYAMDEDGQVNVPETTTVQVPIENNGEFTINYVSGGGTGGGPGWESENVYTITAPDGMTQFSDGPIPAEGVVTLGINVCN